MTGSLSIGDTNTVGNGLGLTIGTNNAASGGRSFAQGNENVASGYNTFASGVGCNATGNNSHAEGQDTTASGTAAHAEGGNATASGGQSHCEGWNSAATYLSSHAEGTGVRSVSQSSHAEGFATVARGRAQHAEGQYNIIDTTTEENTATRGAYIHIAGNGADDGSYRSNAHTLDWSGNAWFSGDVYTGSTSGTNKDEGSKKLATEEYVNSHGNVVSGTYTGSSSATTITATGISTIKYAMITSADEKLVATITPNGDAIISRGENVSGVTEKVMVYHLASVTISGNTITIGSTSMLNEDQSEYYYMVVG